MAWPNLVGHVFCSGKTWFVLWSERAIHDDDGCRDADREEDILHELRTRLLGEGPIGDRLAHQRQRECIRRSDGSSRGARWLRVEEGNNKSQKGGWMAA